MPKVSKKTAAKKTAAKKTAAKKKRVAKVKPLSDEEVLIEKEYDRIVKRGRPPKFKKSMLLAIERMTAEGACKSEICAEIGISRETMKQWTDPNGLYYNEIFSDTVQLCLQDSEAWWRKKGRKNLTTTGFNTQLYSLNMKNRFSWGEKISVDSTSSDGSMTPSKVTRIIIDSGVKNDPSDG